MTAPSKLLVAFAAAALAVCVTGAASAERSTSSLGQKPPAETPIQIMPAGIYPLTPEREQALRPKDSFKECDACPEMGVVPKGSFIMGTPITEVDRSKGEDPLHRVTFARPFAVGRFTISFDEWDRIHHHRALAVDAARAAGIAVALGHAVEILHDNIDARDYGSPFAGTTK